MPSGSQPQPLPLPDADALRCEISRERDGARILAIGELDVATVPILEAELDALRSAGFRRLILDLSGLGFMDSTGLRCVLDYDAEARQDGFTLALLPGSQAVQRVFQLTNTEAHLPFIDPDRLSGARAIADLGTVPPHTRARRGA